MQPCAAGSWGPFIRIVPVQGTTAVIIHFVRRLGGNSAYQDFRDGLFKESKPVPRLGPGSDSPIKVTVTSESFRVYFARNVDVFCLVFLDVERGCGQWRLCLGNLGEISGVGAKLSGGASV